MEASKASPRKALAHVKSWRGGVGGMMIFVVDCHER